MANIRERMEIMVKKLETEQNQLHAKMQRDNSPSVRIEYNCISGQLQNYREILTKYFDSK